MIKGHTFCNQLERQGKPNKSHYTKSIFLKKKEVKRFARPAKTLSPNLKQLWFDLNVTLVGFAQ